MKKKINQIVLTTMLFLSVGIVNLRAQVAITSSGGNSSGSSGSVSYSVGQSFYTAVNQSKGSLFEGVQQPYEISVVTGIEKPGIATIKCIAYPNPTSDYLTLDLGTEQANNHFLRLIDSNGKQLIAEKAVGQFTKIEMQDLIPAVYFLIVSQDNNEIKTFKIIKK